jgi:hypothetical protein
VSLLCLDNHVGPHLMIALGVSSDTTIMASYALNTTPLNSKHAFHKTEQEKGTERQGSGYD